MLPKPPALPPYPKPKMRLIGLLEVSYKDSISTSLQLRSAGSQPELHRASHHQLFYTSVILSLRERKHSSTGHFLRATTRSSTRDSVGGGAKHGSTREFWAPHAVGSISLGRQVPAVGLGGSFSLQPLQCLEGSSCHP